MLSLEFIFYSSGGTVSSVAACIPEDTSSDMKPSLT